MGEVTNSLVNTINLVNSINTINTSQISQSNLTYPFFWYPFTPACEYDDYPTYINQINKLYNLIPTLNSELESRTNQSKIIFHLTIGASMEELASKGTNIHSMQWQQLFPAHLEKAHDDGYDITHIIISPNEHFNPSNYIEPKFIKETNYFEWKLCRDQGYTSYTSSDSRFRVYIFCTPMPTVCRVNEQNIRKLLSSPDSFIRELGRNLVQTQVDKDFIGRFYLNLRNLANKIRNLGGLFTCFSFAVFKNMPGYDEYRMFPEIINLFPLGSSNRLLAEWVYIDDSYYLRRYSAILTKINYSRFARPDIDNAQSIDYESGNIILV